MMADAAAVSAGNIGPAEWNGFVTDVEFGTSSSPLFQGWPTARRALSAPRPKKLRHMVRAITPATAKPTTTPKTAPTMGPAALLPPPDPGDTSGDDAADEIVGVVACSTTEKGEFVGRYSTIASTARVDNNDDVPLQGADTTRQQTTRSVGARAIRPIQHDSRGWVVSSSTVPQQTGNCGQ